MNDGQWVNTVLWLMAKVYNRQMTAEEATVAAIAALRGDYAVMLSP